ncbi:MAG TPA: hypothetical protein VGD80_09140 [Kofleriaceae bacterium]
MRYAVVVLVACGADVTPPAIPAAPVAPEMAASPLVEPPEAEAPEAPVGIGDPRPVSVSELGELDASEHAGTGLDVDPLWSQDSSTEGEVWLKGSTHVHARASGDSSESNDRVIAWYEEHRYDFIVLTDHNRVTELDATGDTHGQITLRDPSAGLIVFSGIELTHNPVGCLPAGDPSRNCRIHVNLIGPLARPGGRLEWAERHSHARSDMYRAARAAQAALGGVAQINHPQWLWGMTPELLVELAQRGMPLVEIANAAFSKWNAGDATHPSTEALWDAALLRGVTLWGVASDDAHDYNGHGKYPPGGGWIAVRARREPRAILAALAAGRFYASDGVVLDCAEVDGDELVVAVDPLAPGNYTIEFIVNGRRAAPIRGKVGRRTLPAAGYIRAVVTRDDGRRAWVQPARR